MKRALHLAWALALAIVACDERGAPLDGRVVILGKEIAVEIADTPAAREQGLSGRPELAPDTGMLFLFDRASQREFWMKDMRFDLDIVWIREERIVDLSRHVPAPRTPEERSAPARVRPSEPADAVLELPAGSVTLYGWAVGQRVSVVRRGG